MRPSVGPLTDIILDGSKNLYEIFVLVCIRHEIYSGRSKAARNQGAYDSSWHPEIRGKDRVTPHELDAIHIDVNCSVVHSNESSVVIVLGHFLFYVKNVEMSSRHHRHPQLFLAIQR